MYKCHSLKSFDLKTFFRDQRDSTRLKPLVLYAANPSLALPGVTLVHRTKNSV